MRGSECPDPHFCLPNFAFQKIKRIRKLRKIKEICYIWICKKKHWCDTQSSLRII